MNLLNFACVCAVIFVLIYLFKYLSIQKYDSYVDTANYNVVQVLDKNLFYVTFSHMDSYPIKMNIIKFMIRFKKI